MIKFIYKSRFKNKNTIMSFETSNHNEANEAQNNSFNSTSEINQAAKDTIDSVKILDPVKSAEMPTIRESGQRSETNSDII